MQQDILAISPHLDDAVLSAGGRLAALAADEQTWVTVYTVFAGPAAPPYSATAERLHGLMDLTGDPVRERRDEDLAAHAELGTIARHGRFPDSIYRTRADGSWLVGNDPTDEPDGDEPELHRSVTAAIGSLIGELRPSIVLTCAALGDHVDHVRTRDAVLDAVSHHPGVRLQLWEDLPYGLWAGQGAQPSSLPHPAVLGDPFAAEVPAEALEAKYRAIACYRSQHRMLWDDDPDYRARLGRHQVANGGGERYWDVSLSRAGVR
jgi:LmbE family N-acetylglucosaminyl deacetylase